MNEDALGILFFLGWAVAGLIGIALYFLPVIVASARKHPSVGGIAIVNLFLGWTFLGWVVALAWAASGGVRQVRR